ncbi:MAG: alpha-hydroxy acid oxidase [Candidatus Planktophila sp.]|nr:alpha-hydroxy acid oxidase [Candidatus Planktophila sp.]
MTLKATFTRMHAEGELTGARATEKYGVPFTLSTVGTTSIEDAFSASVEGANWFQLYMWKDRDASMQLVGRARKAGVTNLILTVDVPVAGARLRDVRNGLTVPPTLSMATLIDAISRREWWWNSLTTKPLEFASTGFKIHPTTSIPKSSASIAFCIIHSVIGIRKKRIANF